MTKTELTRIMKEVVEEIQSLQPGLFKDFVSYWQERKSQWVSQKRNKKYNLSNWLNLIESNQKFRDKFGEETADKLIFLIEEGMLDKVC